MNTPLTVKELPYLQDSTAYFEQIRELSWPIWLDSGYQRGKENLHARYDILSAAPALRLITNRDGCEVKDCHNNLVRHYKDCWSALKDVLEDERETTHLPFTGGAIGYLGYDLGRQLENLKDTTQADTNLPLSLLGIYHWGIIQDHQKQISHLVYRPSISSELKRQIEKISTSGRANEKPLNKSFKASEFKPDTAKEKYLQDLTGIDSFIRAGDCYQVNYTQRFKAHYTGDTFSAYQTLRKALPSPFSCYFETEYGAILSHSPERFIAVNNGAVVTQPIKGTAPRGKTPKEDEQLANGLKNSSKNKAENLMIVDLLRNDLSKTCKPQSVKTPKLFNLESYPNVHHLVSTVTGELNDSETPLDLLKSSFPGGSITGAPKIRAMQIIEELEATRRSVYCGSIGYLGFNGKMDTNIAIRTAAADGESIYVWAGGGIVADSVIEEEYQESLLKIDRILTGLSDTESTKL